MDVFTPTRESPATILRRAEGTAATPNLPGSGTRIVIILDEVDAERYRGLPTRGTITVTDQMTGLTHKVKRAACGAGCRCAAEIVP